ncbi:MAG: radical SAM protein, partial [Candidatus Aenigmatarchaeota archaeon]
DFVIFSLDFSDPKKHDGFRGMPGLFDCVVSNIERLKNTTKVRIRAVITSENVGELPELARFASELGITELQLQPVNPYVGVVENGMVVERAGVCIDQKSLWIKPDQYSLLDKVVDELIAFKEKHGLISNSVNYLQLLKRYFRTPRSSDLGFSCPGGNYFGIQYDGRVVPCWGIDWNIGSIREKPLQQILNSKEYFNGRNLMKTCNFPCMQVCYQNLGKSVDAAQNASFPSTWKIEPTTRCNLQCPACPTGKGLVPFAEMSFSQYKKIIDENFPHIKTLLLWGYGEPLLHKDIAKMVRYAKDKGIGCVKTSTNCHFLTKKKIQQLLHSKLDHLIVCLDGASEETYLKYRKNGNFKKVLRSIRFLVQEKKKLEKPIIELQFIIMSHNEHEIEIVKELAKQLGVDRLSLKTAGILPGDKHLLPSQEKYNRYAKVNNEKSCNLPSELVFVRADGSVNPCFRLRSDIGEEYVMGNVFSEPFVSIWNSRKYVELKARVFSERLKTAVCCDCPLPGNSMYYEEKEVMAD